MSTVLFSISIYILSMVVVFAILQTNSVYGSTNLEKAEIIAESTNFGNDFVLNLQFGADQFMRGKMVPTVDSGTLHFFDDSIELQNVQAKIMGNSFVVKSDELLAYAKGLGNSEYKINAYLITASGFTKYELKTKSENPISYNPEKKQEEEIDLQLFLWNYV